MPKYQESYVGGGQAAPYQAVIRERSGSLGYGGRGGGDMPIDIAGRAFKQDPHGAYRTLRMEGPVVPVRVGRRQAWLVTRYDDVVRLLKDGRFVKDRSRLTGRAPWVPAFARPLARNMLDVDEPDHKRLRALVSQAFTPRIVDTMKSRVESIVEELLDRAATRGAIDLIEDYALPIPTTIIAEILGVAAGDRHRFHRWTKAIVVADTSAIAMARALPAVLQSVRYLRGLIREKRETGGGDLTSALVAARDGNDRLSEDELMAMVFLLLVAGHETTVNLISNGVLRLMERPEARERLLGDPSLTGSAVEEILRFDGPLLTATERYTVARTEFAGVTIPAGATVYGAIASANRDERALERPDTLDIARSPNRHLSFGDGPHFCAGAALARMEGQIAIPAILARFPAMKLVPGAAIVWKRGVVLRGMEALPVTLR